MLAQFDWNKNILACLAGIMTWLLGFHFSSGMTTGMPIHVIVPNTDQVGGVSIY